MFLFRKFVNNGSGYRDQGGQPRLSSKACSQITAGALVAESLIQHENAITFLPIILHGRGLKTIERRNLEKTREN